MTDMVDFNEQVIEDFRANGGKVGGMFEGVPLLILHTTGAKTGRELISPLIYHAEVDRLLIFAAKGGDDVSPAWYHNLVANPDVTVELGTGMTAMRATVITGVERDRIYAEQVERMPAAGDYQRKTTRVIPVIMLQRA